MNYNSFVNRHIGPRVEELNEMIRSIGANSVDELIDKTIPAGIRLTNELQISKALSEADYLSHCKTLASKNKVFKSFIGTGYYGTIVPSVVLRNILENPGWYTAYTPYQAEISQGRLEALLNFQTMVSDLTGMELANASLLDEATAAAEAMLMFYNARERSQVKAGINKFFLSETCFPQTKDIVLGRAKPLGIDVIIGDSQSFNFTDEFFGGLIQYPDANGEIPSYRRFVESAHSCNAKVGVAADIMSLVLLEAPSSWGADAVVGCTQRFGVPMGFGGPHAAFFATKEKYKRHIPGRIIGVSVDKDGNKALRMALQTREQHIKRDRATSNICTAQALLATMASFYVAYHGPKGLKEIATDIHKKTVLITAKLKEMGCKIVNDSFFDTITITGLNADNLRSICELSEINLRYDSNGNVGISVDETTSLEDINSLLQCFAEAIGKNISLVDKIDVQSKLSSELRTDEILQFEVFNRYHSETEMMRYMKALENKDLSLVHSMISLGSCTMKLNAASELIPITWPEFSNIHPFAPENQTTGYLEMIDQLDKDLSEITGFAKVSMQPNSGAQGEYAGLMVIKSYLESKGEPQRNICLIPASAHGTNPASAVMAGMKVVVTKCDELGNIDVLDLREKAEQYKETLSALMVTYPSTHGVYEEAIKEITQIIHDNGGQVYMDGANMNAQVGLTNPGNIGADVCHLNLHKTFSIPHGGGGPGVGPIGVAAHLVPFLPGNCVHQVGGDQAIHGISAAPYGSALILLISYGYIKMLGKQGVKDSTVAAIVNANYLKSKLDGEYTILYSGSNNAVAHEMIVDCRGFKKSAGIEVEDIAKRLIDYGFHAPTVSFPVAGTLMIEPTESESKAELDRFVHAMLSIREEIRAIETGKTDPLENVLKHAPHTVAMLLDDEWNKPYSRKEAAFPVDELKNNKYWVPVRRIDNSYGDRNLICSCPPLESYQELEVEQA